MRAIVQAMAARVTVRNTEMVATLVNGARPLSRS
jgi:hypothetical protein